jgi:tRNA A58 N-methylase Trm61
MKEPVNLANDRLKQIVSDNPGPWRMIERRSGIIVKDVHGVTVLFLAFSGEISRERKRRTASLITEAINQLHETAAAGHFM